MDDKDLLEPTEIEIDGEKFKPVLNKKKDGNIRNDGIDYRFRSEAIIYKGETSGRYWVTYINAKMESIGLKPDAPYEELVQEVNSKIERDLVMNKIQIMASSIFGGIEKETEKSNLN